MASGSGMERARGDEWTRGAGTSSTGQARCDLARSDDARDGRFCCSRSVAEGSRLARYSGRRHHCARPRRQGPRETELGGTNCAGQGNVPGGRPGRAHPTRRAEPASSYQRDGSGIVTKILYIEDNDDNVYMLKMRLELLGDFEVLAAENGEKGCEMAATEQPDLILMDLEMPVVDGWEATRRLKGSPTTRDIPIIALSAHALGGEREKALQGVTSSIPNQSSSIGWSRHFGAFSRLTSKIWSARPPSLHCR